MPSLQKNYRLVSGYRFSDTVTSSKSDAPLGADVEKLLYEKTNPPYQRLAGGIRERSLFLISQLTLSPAPNPTEILIPAILTDSPETRSVGRSCTKGWI